MRFQKNDISRLHCYDIHSDACNVMGLQTFLFLILSQYVLKYNKIRCLGPPKKVVLNSKRVLITGGHDGEPCNVL